MFAARSIRQRGAARVFKSSLPSSVQSRSSHHVPPLSGGEAWAQNGIGKFMSPQQFDIAWTKNQARLVGHLNRLTDGGTYENRSTKMILLATARDPNYAPHFNYASMAHNNNFFFDTITDTPTRPGKNFANQLTECFSSPASFRAAFLATAEAMFGPGFVWLVQNNDVGIPNKYAILVTYQAGSPYPGAVYRRQEKDMAVTPNNYRQGQGAGTWSLGAEGFERSRAPGQGSEKLAPGGQDLTPLMCVSTWEHAYLHDYGVDGKRAYLERWWDSIDWNKVDEKRVYSRVEDADAFH